MVELYHIPQVPHIPNRFRRLRELVRTNFLPDFEASAIPFHRSRFAAPRTQDPGLSRVPGQRRSKYRTSAEPPHKVGEQKVFVCEQFLTGANKAAKAPTRLRRLQQGRDMAPASAPALPLPSGLSLPRLDRPRRRDEGDWSTGDSDWSTGDSDGSTGDSDGATGDSDAARGRWASWRAR
jgi:hypothetical protein